LSDYTGISFTVNSTTGSSSQYKQCNVAGAVGSAPAYTNPNANASNSVFVTTYDGSGNTIGNTWPTTLNFTIDKTRTLTNTTLTGEIWLAVFINASSGANYTISNFELF